MQYTIPHSECKAETVKLPPAGSYTLWSLQWRICISYTLTGHNKLPEEKVEWAQIIYFLRQTTKYTNYNSRFSHLIKIHTTIPTCLWRTEKYNILDLPAFHEASLWGPELGPWSTWETRKCEVVLNLSGMYVAGTWSLIYFTQSSGWRVSESVLPWCQGTVSPKR